MYKEAKKERKITKFNYQKSFEKIIERESRFFFVKGKRWINGAAREKRAKLLNLKLKLI